MDLNDATKITQKLADGVNPSTAVALGSALHNTRYKRGVAVRSCGHGKTSALRFPEPSTTSRAGWCTDRRAA